MFSHPHQIYRALWNYLNRYYVILLTKADLTQTKTTYLISIQLTCKFAPVSYFLQQLFSKAFCFVTHNSCKSDHFDVYSIICKNVENVFIDM